MEVDVEVAVDVKKHGRYSVLVVDLETKTKRRKQPMLTTAQLIERTAHRQLRNRVRSALQPGALNAVVASEISSIITEVFNAQLKAERDEALGRAPYERADKSPQRNGFKLMSVPGLWGRLTLRRPVVRQGTLQSPLLAALKTAGHALANVL